MVFIFDVLAKVFLYLTLIFNSIYIGSLVLVDVIRLFYAEFKFKYYPLIGRNFEASGSCYCGLRNFYEIELALLAYMHAIIAAETPGPFFPI